MPAMRAPLLVHLSAARTREDRIEARKRAHIVTFSDNLPVTNRKWTLDGDTDDELDDDDDDDEFYDDTNGDDADEDDEEDDEEEEEPWQVSVA